MFKRLMNKLFLSCFKATELLEKKLHFKLSISEKYQLKIHKMMCEACRRYESQSLFIDNQLKHPNTISPNSIDVEALKNQIKNKIDS